ncbi:lysophospholipid acyltransferase family protein [Mycoplasmopsis iners]|uniref:lysophospholipid acyltransferase family protein n=1 Tax=Mycoplasmopsis iners TaxID=76630 RepID=UPI000497FFBF|nr:lysophospholipid acyltransferase family protein [Mycoplasmopsis iners]
MSFIFKMIFCWPLMLWYMWRLRAYARKYKKFPAQHTPQQRNNWLLKRARLILWLYNVKVQVEGYNNIPNTGAILTPNHKSNLDAIIMLYALKKQTKDASVLNKIPNFLAKKELEKSKLAMAAIKLSDSTLIDRNNFRSAFASLAEFGSGIKERRTYGVVFPEGTRIDSAELGEFKTGAFKVAISQYLAVVPVAISDTREAMKKSRSKKLIVKVTFLPAIKPANLLASQPQKIAERVKKAIEGELNNEQN